MRIASIVQKGIKTGRSSYVEMRALERIVHHNITTKVQRLRASAPGQSQDSAELLSRVLSSVSRGYAGALTPNGIVRKGELDHLLAIDSEIVTCLGVLESQPQSREKGREIADTLKELIEERKRLVGSLRA